MPLKGHTAVVTGAAGHIGAAITRRFLQEGAQVALLDRNAEGLDIITGQLQRDGFSSDDMIAVLCDVQQPNSVEDAFARVDNQWNSLDIVVANAGVAKSAPFVDIDIENWNTTLAINLTGVFLVCQAAARRMLRRGTGSIITMSSTNGLAGERGLAAYNASKAGVLLLTKTMAIELAPFGIRANALNPGFIDTGLAARSGVDPEFIAQYYDKIPMGRFGTADEVASAALFLATDASKYINGISLVIDGGQLAEE